MTSESTALSTTIPIDERSTLTASATVVRPGDEVTFRVECRDSQPPWVNLRWIDRQDFQGSPIGDDYSIPLTTGSQGVYEATIVMPYWIGPGTQRVTTYCVSVDNNPEPLELDVVEPEEGPWDVWRPRVRPWIVEPIPEFALPSDQPNAAFDLQVTDGDRVTLAALCDPAAPRSGGRFIIWARLIDPTGDQRNDAFFTIEYPVADSGYAETDDGVVITAEIEFRADDFPPLDSFLEPTVAALCTATPTPFEADAEPDPLPGDTLHIEFYLPEVVTR